MRHDIHQGTLQNRKADIMCVSCGSEKGSKVFKVVLNIFYFDENTTQSW